MSLITLISAVPTFVTLEEHQAITGSTPASFDSIPPILHYKEDNVLVNFVPPLEGLQENQGTLYLLENALVFASNSGNGFEIKYPAITLHAISRAESGPCIYCQIDEGGVAENAEDAEDDKIRELKIFPSIEASLDSIFEALSHCASLNPDPSMDDDDAFIDADPSNFETFTGDGEEELSEVGRAALEHLESIIEDPNGLVKESGVNGH